MKILLICCLLAVFAVITNAHKQSSSKPRTFPSYVKQKIDRICGEVRAIKHKVEECCNPSGCTYGGKTFSHGSIFPASDGCNNCVCNKGAVECTDAPGCGQGAGGANYLDSIAQVYCAGDTGYSADAGGRMSAVRRDCSNTSEGAAPTCEDMCQIGTPFGTSIKTNFPDVHNSFCSGAIWVWMEHPELAPNPGPGQTDPGKLNLVTISYDAATGCPWPANDCGPNYCCCYAYTDPAEG